MNDFWIRKVTASYQDCLSKLNWTPGIVPLTATAPWFGVIEWSAPDYDRDHIFSGVGALVGPRHVLTCAQRVDPKMDERFIGEGGLAIADKTFRVRIGGVLGTDYDVQQVVSHPKFRPTLIKPSRVPRKSMDLAILVLTEDVNVTPVEIAEFKSVKPYERISALGTGPSADGPYDPVQFDTAQINPLAGAPAKPWGKEFVVANAPAPDTMGPNFLGAPVVTLAAGPGNPKLVGMISRGAQGLPTEHDHGAPCVATDVIRQAKWITKTVAAYPARAGKS